MHPIFSVTLFTGQQLVLEAIQRWLQRPCVDAEAQRQRRLGLKGLVTLLLRTAATGVLATLLDAAIEFRRRQLLAAAAAEPGDVAAAAAAGGSRFPGLGMVSRAGVAAWKGRLLLCIDELERRAQAYGIEARHRFSEGKPAAAADGEEEGAAASAARGGGKSATASSLAALARAGNSSSSSSLSAFGEESAQHLGSTVEQLRELVKQGGGDPDSERRLDEEAGSLVDILLGVVPLPPSPSITTSRSRSVPSALNLLGGAGLRASRSRASLTGMAAAAAAGAAWPEEQASPSSPTGSSGPAADVCQICMDRPITLQDHVAPQCPFCRQSINGFLAIPSESHSSGGAAACSAVAAGPACTALQA